MLKSCSPNPSTPKNPKRWRRCEKDGCRCILEGVKPPDLPKDCPLLEVAKRADLPKDCPALEVAKPPDLPKDCPALEVAKPPDLPKDCPAAKAMYGAAKVVTVTKANRHWKAIFLRVG
jgi:hypothetical protein